MIGNVLRGGSVADRSNTESSTYAIRDVNSKIAGEGRVESCIAPIGDGIHMASKK